MPTTVYDKSTTLAGTDDGGADNTVNQRVVHKAAVLGAASGNQIRLTLLWGASSASVSGGLGDIWVGQGATTGNEYNFTGDQVQVTFSGSTTANSSAAGVLVSDWITLAQNYDNTRNYVVSLWLINNATISISTAAVTNVDVAGDNGGADAAAATAPTLPNTTANVTGFIEKIEIQAAAGGFVPYNPWPQAAPLLAQQMAKLSPRFVTTRGSLVM